MLLFERLAVSAAFICNSSCKHDYGNIAGWMFSFRVIGTKVLRVLPVRPDWQRQLNVASVQGPTCSCVALQPSVWFAHQDSRLGLPQLQRPSFG